MEKVKAYGTVRVYVNGVLVRKGNNLVVNDGYALIARLCGSSDTQPSHMAVGSSQTAPTATQLTLIGTEIERVAMLASVSGRTLNFTATFGAGITGTASIQEMGIFNNATGGNMLARWICELFHATSSDDVVVEWEVVFGE